MHRKSANYAGRSEGATARPAFAYFIGIGGIGMSALARLLAAQGCRIFGYDRSESPLVQRLRAEGMTIHCEETVEAIPETVRTHPAQTWVVYTPAIPPTSPLLVYCKEGGYALQKRAAVLGAISRSLRTVAVAGTHGKTTTSALIAHALHRSALPTVALVGGLVRAYETNLLHNSPLDAVELLVAEADEFDRSFLHLHPAYSVVTSMDADHPETYGSLEEMEASYGQFLRQTTQTIAVHHGVAERIQLQSSHRAAFVTYGLHRGDVHATNLMEHPRGSSFDCVTQEGCLTGLRLPMAGVHNVENALAAVAVCLQLGLPPEAIRSALAAFPGVDRRFAFALDEAHVACIDDYAHHPMEIKALMTSVRSLYPKSHLTVLFQPHLFSRTQAYYAAFAQWLSLADRLLLLPIYPARERPIPGVTAELILHAATCPQKSLETMETLERHLVPLSKGLHQVFVVVGAGDIGEAVPAIVHRLRAAFR